jgi:ferredoxin
MRVTVDLAVCQDHGQCAIAGPGVFRMNEAGKLEFDAEPGEACRGEAEDAADACPTQAISIEG